MEFLVHNVSHSDLIVELSWRRDGGDGAACVAVPPSASDAAPSSTLAVADHVSATTTTAAPSDAQAHAHAHAKSPTHLVTADGARVPLSLLARPKFSLFQQISQAIMDRVEELRGAESSHGASQSATGGVESPSGSTSAASTSAASAGATSPTHAPTKSDKLPASMLGIAAENAHHHPTPPKKGRRVRWKATCTDTQSPIGFNLSQSPIPVTDLHDFRLRGGLDTLELVEKHWSRVVITAVYFPLIALLLPKWLNVLREFKSENSKQIVYLISGAGIPRNVAHSMQGNSTETTARLIAVFVDQYYPQMQVHQVHSGSNIFRFDDNVQFMTRELRPRLEGHRNTIVERSGEAWRSHFHVTIAYADGPPARLSALNASLRIFRPSYLHVWQLKTYWHERRLSMEDVDFHSFENIEASPCVPYAGADEMTQLLVKEMRVFRDQFLQGEALGEVGSFWLRKSRKPVLAVLLIEKVDANGIKTLVAHRGMNCEVSMPTGSLCAERNAIGSALARDPTLQRHALKMIGVLGITLGGSAAAATRAAAQPDALFAEIPHANGTSGPVASLLEPPLAVHVSGATPTAAPTAAGSPSASTNGKRRLENANLSSPRKPKRPRTFSCDDASVEAALQQQEQQDRNPLAPCGACKEWLLKIAEANPAFRVVTFENARCRSVYINQIM